MARVRIDGVGIVEVPDGTDEEVMASARVIRDKYQVDPVDYRAQGLGALASRGLQRSYEGLKGTIFDLIPALGAATIGADDYAKQQLDEYKERMEKAEQANPTAFTSYKQADSFGNALGYGAETIGELGPDIAAFTASFLTGSMGAGALARRGTAEVVEGLAEKLAKRKGIDVAVAREAINKQVTGALAEKSAKDLGGKIGIGAASAGINIPDTLQGVYEDTGELRPDLAFTIGSLVAALDTYLPSKLLSQLGSAGKAKLAEEMVKKSSVVPTTWKKEFGKALGMTAAGEGITEGTQESLQIFANQLAGSQDPFFSQENIDRIINSAIKGTIGGSVIGAPGAAVQAAQVKNDRLANIAAQTPQQGQPAQGQQLPPEAPPPQLPPPSPTTPPAPPAPSSPSAPPSALPPLPAPPPPAPPAPPSGSLPPAPNLDDLSFLRKQTEAKTKPPKPLPESATAGLMNLTNDKGTSPDIKQAIELAKTLGIEIPPNATLPEVIAKIKAAAIPPEDTSALASLAPVTLVTPELLKQAGLKPQSGFFKQLNGLDRAKPEDLTKIKNIVEKTKPNNAIDTKALTSILNIEEATNGTAPTTTISRPDGESVSVSDRPTSATGRLAPAKPTGMGVFENVAAGLGTREEVQPGTLTTTEKNIRRLEIDLDKKAAKGKDVTKERAELEVTKAREAANKKAEEKAEPKEEPKAKVKEEPKPKVKAEPKAEPKAESKPKTKAEIKVETEALQEQIDYYDQMSEAALDPKEKTTINKDINNLKAQLAGLKAATTPKAKERIKKTKFREVKNEGLLTRREVEEIANNTVTGWKKAPPVQVVEYEKQLPDYIQEQMEIENVKRIGGVFDPNSGVVYLVSKNLIDTPDVVRTILHETVGHFGLRAILGDKYTNTMNSIYAGNKEVKDLADIKIANGMGQPLAVEEVLAEMVESNTNPTLLQKVVNIIRQILRSIGKQFKDVTNGEIMQLIKDSHKYVTEGIGVYNGGNVRFGAVFSADAPIFYSKLAAMVAGAPKQFDSASERQWRDWISSNAGKNQVKKEELEYSGIFDYLFLGRDKNEKISKEQVLQFLEEEGPKVTEVILGKTENQDRIDKLKEQFKELNKESNRLFDDADTILKYIISKKHLDESAETIIADETTRRMKKYVRDGYTVKIIEKLLAQDILLKYLIELTDITETNFKTELGKDAFNEYKNIQKKLNINYSKMDVITDKLEDLENEINPTKFENYTYERGYGLKNYREIVLTLPTKKPTKKPTDKLTVMQNADFTTYSVNDRNLNQIGPNFNTAAEAREWLADYKGEAIYTHSHWEDVANPIVHIRFNEKIDGQGNRVLFVEELQSDWGQAYYKDLNPTVEIEKVTDARYEGKPFITNYTGYINNIRYAKGKTEEEAKKNSLEAYKLSHKPTVPQAPFVTEPKSYTALAIKRLLRYAADNGYDKISFISGEEAHKRFPTDANGKSTKEGMKTHYDVRIPSVVKDIFKKLSDNANERTENLKVKEDYELYTVVVKFDNGVELEYESSTFDNITEAVADTYHKIFGTYPRLKKDLMDIVQPNKVFIEKGNRLRGVRLGNAVGAGYDLQSLLSDAEYIEQPMNYDIRSTTVKGVRPFFTIDLNPQTAEKVQRGQAMFSVKENATFRNHPNVPGVTNEDAQSIFDGFIDKIATAPFMNQNRANALHEVLKKGVFGNALTVILSSLPVNVLGMEAERVGLKGATGIGRLIDEQSSYINEQNKKIEPLVRMAEAWVKRSSPEMAKLFNSVVYGSTTSRVDPTKDKKDYSTDKHADYDRIKAEYIRLDDSGKKLYVDMRNAYGAMYDEIVRAINERIDTFSVNDTTKTKIKADIMTKLVAQGKIEPYFALTRKGNYWLSYNMRDKSGQVETYIEAFEHERARTRVIAELKKEGATDIEQFSKLAEYQFARAPSGSFVNKVLQVLEVNKPKTPANLTAEQKEKYDAALKKYEENTEEVMRLYISTLPETSFAQSFRKRQDVLGFKEDAVEALRDRLYSTTQQVGRMVFGAKINKLMSDMKTLSKAITKGTDAKDNKLVNEYIKIFEKHIAANSVNNNNLATKTGNLINTLTFNYQLGFNISSAVVQLAQIPMVVTPYLAGDHNWADTMRAIGDARRAFIGSGFNNTTQMVGSNEKVTNKAMPSMSNYDFDNVKLPAEIRKLKTLYDLANGEGQLNRSSFYDVLEVDGRKNILNTVNATSGWIFHHADRMNREITLIAAYNLQLAKLNKKGIKGKAAEEAAARYAADVSKLTNGNVAAGNAPLISKNALGKVLFMYKGYGVSMYYMLFKTLRDILQKQDKEVRKIAMRQMAGIYGSAALYSGIQGIPMFGMLAMIYNLFADDDEDDFETATRKYVGEFMYKGLINEITGLDVAGRIGLSDLIFRTNPTSQSATFQDAFLQTFGGPAYGAGSKFMRGLSKIQEGNIERGIEDILPSAAGNLLKSFRYGTEGATTMRGDPMIEDFSVFSVGAQALGFTPAELSLQQAINAKAKGIEKAVLDEKNKLLQRYNISDRVGDIAARDEYKEKLRELNRKHPGLGINEETFERSRRAFKESTKRMVNGVQYSKKLEQEMLDNIAAYN